MKAPRIVCPECGRTYSGRWHYSTGPNDRPCWVLRRHGWPEICDGSGCEPEPPKADWMAFAKSLREGGLQ